MLKVITAVFLALSPLPLAAQQVSAEDEDYIRANTIFFFYHEFGHALIDMLRLPVFGQEEDAADVLGVVLTEETNAPEDSDFIVAAAADNFAYMAEAAEQDGYALAFWDTHGLDQQRYYTIICLHYGADTLRRQYIADSSELPEERQVSCEEEWQLAIQSWGPVLDDIERLDSDGTWLSLNVSHTPENPAEEILLDAIRIEVQTLNELFDPRLALRVNFERCGEANAFYDPNTVEIIICSELVELFLE